MAVSLTHTTVAVGTDAGNGEIAKAQWNEGHTLTAVANSVLARAAATDGAVSDVALAASQLAGRGSTGDVAAIAISSELSMSGTTLGVGGTLTGKTLSGAILNDGYTEEVFAIPSSTTPALSPNNGSIQTWTLTGTSTPTQGTWVAGQSMILMINDTASAFTVNWTSVPVTWVGGSAPTLAPSGGFTVIVLWEVGTTVYGALIGQVA